MQEIIIDPGSWTIIEPTTVRVRWDGVEPQTVQYDEDTNTVYLPPYDPDLEGLPLWNVNSGDAPLMRIGEIPEIDPSSPESMWPGGFTVLGGKWKLL